MYICILELKTFSFLGLRIEETNFYFFFLNCNFPNLDKTEKREWKMEGGWKKAHVDIIDLNWFSTNREK